MAMWSRWLQVLPVILCVTGFSTGTSCPSNALQLTYGEEWQPAVIVQEGTRGTFHCSVVVTGETIRGEFGILINGSASNHTAEVTVSKNLMLQTVALVVNNTTREFNNTIFQCHANLSSYIDICWSKLIIIYILAVQDPPAADDPSTPTDQSSTSSASTAENGESPTNATTAAVSDQSGLNMGADEVVLNGTNETSGVMTSDGGLPPYDSCDCPGVIGFIVSVVALVIISAVVIIVVKVCLKKSKQGGILEVSTVTAEMLVCPTAGCMRTPDKQVYLPKPSPPKSDEETESSSFQSDEAASARHTKGQTEVSMDKRLARTPRKTQTGRSFGDILNQVSTLPQMQEPVSINDEYNEEGVELPSNPLPLQDEMAAIGMDNGGGVIAFSNTSSAPGSK